MNIRFVLYILPIVSALCATVSNAQTKIDSLLQIRAGAGHDSVRIKTDILIGRDLESSDFDSAFYYYNRALSLAQSEISLTQPKLIGTVLGNMGFAYIYGKNDVPKGISLLKQALASHLEKKLYIEASQAEFNIGFFYGSQSKYDSALFHFNRVIDRNKALPVKSFLHESYNNAGLMYYYKGQYALSAQYLTKAVRLKEQTGETHEIHHTYTNLGTTFSHLNQFERSNSYYTKAMESQIDDSVVQATGHRNIAENLIEQGRLDEAQVHVEKAYAIAKARENQVGISFYYKALGRIEEEKGEIQKAHDNYLLARINFPHRVNDRYSSSVMNSLGRVKLKWVEEDKQLSLSEKKKIIEEAIQLGEESWKRAVRSDIINRKLGAAEVLKLGYEKVGDYKKALQFADSAYVLTNAINSQAQSQAIAFATTEYETERVENENVLLQETQKVQEAQLKQQNFVIYGAMVVMALILIIGTVIYRSRLRLQKANQQVEKSLSEKELLLKEIHHRVKNNLQVVSSLLDLQSRGIEDEKALATFMEGQNRVKAMALIHQKLYQNEDLSTIDFEEYAKNLIKELASLYPSAAGVKTNIQTHGDVQFDIDTAVPLGLILNELISNAYKYAFDGSQEGELNVSVESLGEGKHQLTVTDTGAGLPEGFDFAKAKSLGLRLVRRLAKQLYGTVDYSGGQGAKFVVHFTDTLQRKTV